MEFFHDEPFHWNFKEFERGELDPIVYDFLRQIYFHLKEELGGIEEKNFSNQIIMSFLLISGLLFSNYKIYPHFFEDLSPFFIKIVTIQISHWKYTQQDKNKPRLQRFLVADSLSEEDEKKLEMRMEKYFRRFYKDNLFSALYNAFSSAQARLLDIQQDTEFLFKMIRRLVMSEVKNLTYVPYVRGVAKKVIIEKTLSHRGGYEQLAKEFSTAQYMEDFSVVLDKILKQWKV